MKVFFHKVKEDDLILLDQFCKDHATFENSEYNLGKNKEQWKNLILGENPRIQCFMVKVDDQSIGYFSFTYDYSTWYGGKFLFLDCLYLIEDFRGKGIGKIIFSFLKEVSITEKCINLQWQTPLSNTNAINFYTKQGAKSKEKMSFTLTFNSS